MTKWFFSELNNFMGFKMISKLYEKHLTPGRYPVQQICPHIKTASIFFDQSDGELSRIVNRRTRPSESPTTNRSPAWFHDKLVISRPTLARVENSLHAAG